MSDPSFSETPRPNRRSWLKILVIGSLLAGGLGESVHLIRVSLLTEKTDDAFLVGHVHRISAGVAGTLLEVRAQDNQAVAAGDLLAQIDPLEYQILEKKALAARQQALARVAQAEAKVAAAQSADLQADAAVAIADAEIQQRQALLELARITLQRNESLRQGAAGAVSQSDLDHASHDLTGAEAAQRAAVAKLVSARAGKQANGSAIVLAQAEIAAAKADIDVSEAGLLEARRQSGLTAVTAPVSGRIGNRNAESGNRVQVGQSLFALVEEDCWIVGNFKETQLKQMRVGQSVDITIDALDGRHFTGTVDSIAPSTGAQFALLPPDNATGNFTKVVQRVPVKIVFDADSLRDIKAALRPGLSAVVRVRL